MEGEKLSNEQECYEDRSLFGELFVHDSKQGRMMRAFGVQ